MTADLITDVLEAIAVTDLSEAPELQRAWDMLNSDDLKWPREIEAENKALREFIAERLGSANVPHVA